MAESQEFEVEEEVALKFRRSSDSDLYCRYKIQETAGEFQEPGLQLPWASPLDRCGEYVEAYSVKTTITESGFWSQSGPSELEVAEEDRDEHLMASVAPEFVWTKQTTNFARLSRLLLDVGKQVLREVFDHIVPPHVLKSVLEITHIHLKSLHQRRVLNRLQWQILFPAERTSVSSESFDILLLVTLLRNICGLSAPPSGWDVLPPSTDISPEADIVRVKYYRHSVYSHAKRASVDDAAFNKYWSEIRETLVRLGGDKYVAVVHHIQTGSVDPEVEETYMEVLQQWKDYEDDVKDKLDEVVKHLDELELESIVPQKDITIKGSDDIPGVAAPALDSTEQTTNFLRLCCLLVNVGTQVLRDVFDGFFPPEFLHDAFNKDPNHATLLSLKRKMIINLAQWGTLFPPSTSLVSSRDFDITLLIVLLQHLCGLSPPLNGWYASPAETELTPAADIVRVKNLRNRLSHAALVSVDDANFRSYWSEIQDALLRLGGVKYIAAIDQLKTQRMSLALEERQKEQLRQWKKNADVKDKLCEIQNRVGHISQKLKDLKTVTVTSAS